MRFARRGSRREAVVYTQPAERGVVTTSPANTLFGFCLKTAHAV